MLKRLRFLRPAGIYLTWITLVVCAYVGGAILGDRGVAWLWANEPLPAEFFWAEILRWTEKLFVLGSVIGLMYGLLLAPLVRRYRVSVPGWFVLNTVSWGLGLAFAWEIDPQHLGYGGLLGALILTAAQFTVLRGHVVYTKTWVAATVLFGWPAIGLVVEDMTSWRSDWSFTAYVVCGLLLGASTGLAVLWQELDRIGTEDDEFVM